MFEIIFLFDHYEALNGLLSANAEKLRRKPYLAEIWPLKYDPAKIKQNGNKTQNAINIKNFMSDANWARINMKVAVISRLLTYL